MTGKPTLENLITSTEELASSLRRIKRRPDRLDWLFHHPIVKETFSNQPQLEKLFLTYKPESLEILLTLLALGQGAAIFTGWSTLKDPAQQLQRLVESLKPLYRHYRFIGGLAGYRLVTLKLISKQKRLYTNQTILCPVGTPLKKDPKLFNKYIHWGLESLPHTGELYPVGGAGDRLNLRDERTGEPLPQARLMFEGKTLLEGLLRDLIGREHLYEQIHGKKIVTPVALMTSPEKKNTQHIQEILEEHRWFGRPKELFYTFEQPQVPVISEEGDFATKGPLELDMKPGGHGVIWQLMKTHSVFDWFEVYHRRHLIVRQINNPLADTDGNLLALLGKGSGEKRAFGFLSCPRRIGAAEGMNVVLSTKNEDGYFTCLTNIEYTEFKDRGIDDSPEDPLHDHSKYPANTNILYADRVEIKKALKHLPLPGVLINLKHETEVFTSEGTRKKVKGGRLESTMQNIADAMITHTSSAPTEEELASLKSFLLLNPRDKTLSVTKYDAATLTTFEDTPKGAWLTKQRNAYELFTKQLDFILPPLADPDDPDFLIDFHPALGPLWSIIAQKIQGGELKKRATLHLDITELFMRGVDLDGALSLTSPNLKGRVYMKNVHIKNEGMEGEKSHPRWRGQLKYKEKFEVILHGESEFFAENVTFEGPYSFEVPEGHRMSVSSVKGKIKTNLEKITSPGWKWTYRLNFNESVALTFNKS